MKLNQLSKSFVNMGPSRWGIICITVVLLIAVSNLKWAKHDYWKNTIASDGKGYYAYLPAIFIYQDLNYSFYDSVDMGKYYDQYNFFDYRIKYGDTYINKYFCGTAMAELPFFMAAHIITIISGGEADGYSKWYQIAITVAAIFWLLVGLGYLDKILILYDVSPWMRLIVLLATIFGTHVFYYTLIEPSMSHIYSFSFVCLFLYFAKKYFLDKNSADLFKMAITLAMVVLIRPINGLIVCALPFVAGDFFILKNTWDRICRTSFPFILPFVLFWAVLSLQLVIYKFSANEFWVYSYTDEGFNFSDPHFFDILFSYRKGLFLYTPMLLLSLFGLYFLWKKSRFEVWTWSVFFLGITYFLSSWWIWYYGGSFSSRVFVEFVPLFMILLAISLRDIRVGWRKNVCISVIFLLIVVCQIQIYQYRYYQIHWSDMTKEKYWDVFLRPDKI